MNRGVIKGLVYCNFCNDWLVFIARYCFQDPSSPFHPFSRYTNTNIKFHRKKSGFLRIVRLMLFFTHHTFKTDSEREKRAWGGVMQLHSIPPYSQSRVAGISNLLTTPVPANGARAGWTGRRKEQLVAPVPPTKGRGMLSRGWGTFHDDCGPISPP